MPFFVRLEDSYLSDRHFLEIQRLVLTNNRKSEFIKYQISIIARSYKNRKGGFETSFSLEEWESFSAILPQAKRHMAFEVTEIEKQKQSDMAKQEESKMLTGFGSISDTNDGSPMFFTPPKNFKRYTNPGKSRLIGKESTRFFQDEEDGLLSDRLQVKIERLIFENQLGKFQTISLAIYAVQTLHKKNPLNTSLNLEEVSALNIMAPQAGNFLRVVSSKTKSGSEWKKGQ